MGMTIRQRTQRSIFARIEDTHIRFAKFANVARDIAQI